MKFFDLFIYAFKSLSNQKIRTFLTILGIVVGIASVVFLVSISQSVQNYINGIVSKMGKNTLTIIPMKQFGMPPEKYFNDKIVKRILSLDFIEYGIYGFYSGAKIMYNGQTKFLPVFYVNLNNFKEYYQNSGITLYSGRYLKSNDKSSCLVGYDVANKLFDKKIKIGDRINLENHRLRVVGILDKVGDQQDDNSIITSLSYSPKKEYNMIMIYLKNGVSKKESIEKIKRTIERYFGDSYSILTSENISKMINSIIGILSVFVVGAAAISLIVGSIGISNTMHMAVLERKKEIGVLKAIGAEEGTILKIFTIESGFLGLIGGIIGIIIGYIFSYIICFFAQSIGYKTFTFWFSPEFTIFILLFSFFVGIVSGYFPSKQASKLNPVDVLREE